MHPYCLHTVFPVPAHNKSLTNTELVAGILVDGKPRAYPLSRLPAELTDGTLRIRYDAAARSVTVTDADGKELPVVIAYWFAWQAFYPRTEIYSSP